MNIRFLGVHNCESRDARMTCLLIDNILALDAGGLTSSLSFEAQTKLKAIFLTHHHYDHIRDIPALGMGLFLNKGQIKICTTRVIYDTIIRHFLNGDVYPDFFQRPAAETTFKFIEMVPFQPQQIEGYSVMPLPVVHAVPAVGYYITSTDGKSIFYTGDTGTSLRDRWQYISPQLIITEVTAPDRFEESIGKGAKHLTPRLLNEELKTFQELKGYLPEIIVLHMNPVSETEIKDEIAAVARTLKASITIAYEGMAFNL